MRRTLSAAVLALCFWGALAWAAGAADHGTIESLMGTQWFVRGLLALVGALLVLLYRKQVQVLDDLGKSIKDLYEGRNKDRLRMARLEQRCDDTHGPPRNRVTDPATLDPSPLRCNDGVRRGNDGEKERP